MGSVEKKIIRGGEMVQKNGYDLMKESSEGSSRKSRMLMPTENYRARFVAFNADYKGPRHHPPKNN